MNSLFDALPLAASPRDPATSRESAHALRASGVQQSQAERVAGFVRRWTGHTSAELAVLAECDRYLAARRLPDAERLGLVVKGEARACKVSGRNAVTWWPAPEASTRGEGRTNA